MDSNTIDQILSLIDKSQKILLLTHARADCDGLGAMLATYLILKNLDKEVIAATNDPTPENLAFLPSVNLVQNSLSASQNFIITLDISRTPLNKIKYNLENNRVNIIVTPKTGTYKKEDISFNQENSQFDLIIVFDAGNLEHLGPIYDQNSELFFKTPIINIDHHASNTDFGQVNMVDLVAASTTEILYKVLKEMEKKYNKKLITPDIATLLLAGIITDTGSFQHANTSPGSMEVSAELIDLGARQQEIVKNIYKTKKLSTLKLWGIVLSKVQADPIHRLVWSTISKEDLQEAGATSDETEGIIDDLLSNAPGAEIIMLIKYNEEGYVSVSMRSNTNQADVGKICAEMGGGGHVRAAGYKIRDGRTLDQVISETLDKVKGYQAKRLNIHPEEPKKEQEKQEEKKEQSESISAPPPAPMPGKPKSGKSTYLDFQAKKSKSEHKKSKPSKKPGREKRPVSPIPSKAEGNEAVSLVSDSGKAEKKPEEKTKPSVAEQKPEIKKPVPSKPPEAVNQEIRPEPKPEIKKQPLEEPKAEQPKPPLKPQPGKEEGEASAPEVPDWLKSE